MKRILLLLLIVLWSGLLVARPRSTKRPAAAPVALSEQIASRITYPTVMREGQHQGIVVISFTVSEENRLSRLTVHTTNQALNDEITRQLVGQKLRLPDNNPFETYTVRLRFVK